MRDVLKGQTSRQLPKCIFARRIQRHSVRVLRKWVRQQLGGNTSCVQQLSATRASRQICPYEAEVVQQFGVMGEMGSWKAL